jgi:hypothetical protein
MLGSLLYWLKPERSARDEGLGLLWLTLALLCKASAVVTPAIVLAWDVIVSRRKFTEALSRQILPGLVCLIALFLNMHAQNQIWGGSREHFEWGLPRILAVDSVLLWRYLRMLVAPFDLSVMYDIRSEGVWKRAAIASAAWLVAGWLVWRYRRTQPKLAWGCATFFLLMFPVLNVFPITTLMNDRYLYLPCLIVFAAAAAAIQAIAGKFAWSVESRSAIAAGGPAAVAAIRRRLCVGTVVAVMMAVAVASYSAMAQEYVEVWRNPVTLWSHAVARTPEMPVVRIQWALTLHDRGDSAKARAVLEDVLRGTRADEGDRLRIARLLNEWSDAPRMASAAAG